MHLFLYSYLAGKLIALSVELLQSILKKRIKVHKNFKIKDTFGNSHSPKIHPDRYLNLDKQSLKKLN